MTMIFTGVPSTQESIVVLTLMLSEEAITGEALTPRTYSRTALQSLRSYLPYCWHPVADSDDLILLGRNYKPIGSAPRRITVRYEDYPHLMAPREVVHSIAGFDPNTHHAPGEPARWFYNDLTAPWNGKRHAENLLKLIRANIDALMEVAP